MNLNQGRRVAVMMLGLLLCVACSSVRERMSLKDGNELYNAEKYEEAIGEYQKILAMNPDHWEANYLIGISYLAMYHPGSAHAKDVEYSDKAIASFQKCLSLEAPGEEEREKVRKFYLSLLISRNLNAQAAEFLEAELAQDPQNATIIAQLAGLYAKQGNFPKSLEYYQRRAEVEPTNKEAWYAIGAACWDRSYNGSITVGNDERERIVDTGIAALDRALTLDPQYFDALSFTNLLYREKSKVMVALGKYVEAQEAYRTADEYQKKAAEASKRPAAAT